MESINNDKEYLYNVEIMPVCHTKDDFDKAKKIKFAYKSNSPTFEDYILDNVGDYDFCITIDKYKKGKGLIGSCELYHFQDQDGKLCNQKYIKEDENDGCRMINL